MVTFHVKQHLRLLPQLTTSEFAGYVQIGLKTRRVAPEPAEHIKLLTVLDYHKESSISYAVILK